MANWKTLLETALKGAKTAAPHILTGAKVAAPYVKSAVKTGAHAVKGTAEFVAKHPKTSLVAGAVSLPYFGYNKGALTFAKEKLLGDDSKEKGLVDTASRLAFGEQRDAYGNEKSISEKAVNVLFGEGSYDSVKRAGGATIDEGQELYHNLKNGVAGIGNEAIGLYQDGKQFAGNFFSGNGMVSNGNGGYYDPTAQSYPSMAQMQMTNQQGGGSMNALMNGMNNAVSQVSGGNVSKMNIASLLLSAYMMFGRFGWMGKAASLLLGGMTLHNINGKQAASQHQNQHQQQSRANVTEQIPLQTAEMPVEEENTVVRMRRL